MRETTTKGIFEIKKRTKIIVTKNLSPGKKVYNEKIYRERGVEYREWDPSRSKLGASILKDIAKIQIKEGDTILYLGSSTGTTISHVSDIIGKNGTVFGVDIAPRVMRDLVFLAEVRKNIVPVLADANHIQSLLPKVTEADFLYQDIAQKNQVDIFLKNLIFLKKGGQAMLCVKARSIDTTRKPLSIFNEVREKIKNKIKIVDFMTLEPFQKDHCVFLCQG